MGTDGNQPVGLVISMAVVFVPTIHSNSSNIRNDRPLVVTTVWVEAESIFGQTAKK